MTIGERKWLSLRGTNGVPEPIGREHYEGTVWCPSVPASYWLARRNGRPFITGNTWPTDLLIKPILAMCPAKVCRVCGKPSERIVGDAEYMGKDGARADGIIMRGGNPVAGTTSGSNSNLTRAAPTLGWTDCGHDNWRTGLVLDPFGGSGTTAVVATGHGRDCVLIDIDERNADLARERVGMFLEIEPRR